MKYMNIIMAFAAEPWALEKSKLITVANFLRLKALSLAVDERARGVTKQTERDVQRAEGSIGVIPIQGVIGERMNLLDDISGGTSSELITKQFRSMLNDPMIKAIVFDVNSPGGVARSVEELGTEIYEARGIKPMIAQVNTCAASAAYWLATQADEVVVTPSGQAGSIGVYAMHEDISEMLAKEGIKETLIYAGEFKVLGNNLEPLSKEARSVMQQRVDALAASFTRDVARGRNKSVREVNDRFGQGLMFNATDLLERGMVDRVATMSETLARFGIDMNPALTRSRVDEIAAGMMRTADDLGEASIRSKLQSWAKRVNEDGRPPPKEFEDILRDAGVSKSQRARIASRVHTAVRSESGDEEANAAMSRLIAAAKAFT